MKKMEFDEFVKEVVEKIREYLPETFAEANVELHTVVKNNNLQLTGLTIRQIDGGNICPTIYLDQFYDAYMNGAELRDILSEIAKTRIEHDVMDTFDVGQITDFSRAKGKIIPRLIGGMKMNADLLRDRPYKAVADLAVTYHILLTNDPGETGTVPVTNQLMESWGVDPNKLHDIAVRNMSRLLPSTFRPISAVLGAMLHDDIDGQDPILGAEDEIFFVLSNINTMFGSTAILDDAIMERVTALLGTDFYILPSSVHELLLVPDNPSIEKKSLEMMVRDVNESCVMSQDRLSNNVYRWSREQGLVIA